MRILWLLIGIVFGGGLLQAESAVVWIGTGGGEARGIYRVELDLETGKISEPSVAAEVRSPGFLAMHPNGTVLYAACQLPDGQGGGVAAYAISSDRQSLELLNVQPIGDGGAAHLTTDRTGACLITAQYGGGSVAVFPLDANGAIGPRSMLVEHEGSGPNKQRQEKPHPHWAGVSPDNQFVFVPDLGIDKIVIYQLDPKAARITAHGEADCPPGGGPRHFVFHPNGQFGYVVNEMAVTITAFRYQTQKGALNAIQTIPALPFFLQEGSDSGSEVRVHPTGKFLYSANRGHDSITVFGVEPDTGRLRFVERESIRGAWPRNFNVDPSGRWLLAGGRHSNSLTSFEIDQDRGALRYTRNRVDCPTPICVLFDPNL